MGVATGWGVSMELLFKEYRVAALPDKIMKTDAGDDCITL